MEQINFTRSTSSLDMLTIITHIDKISLSMSFKFTEPKDMGLSGTFFFSKRLIISDYAHVYSSLSNAIHGGVKSFLFDTDCYKMLHSLFFLVNDSSLSKSLGPVAQADTILRRLLLVT